MSKEKIVCPKCGTLMNYHADKPDRRIESSSQQADADIELANIMQVHFCPGCRNTEVRSGIK
jgi:Fe2+ or Zn2+ uptake regulation protein